MRRAPALAVAIAGIAAGPALGARGPSGMVGRIVAGPTCPVESVPPSPQCAPRPLQARVRIHPVGRRSPVEIVRSGADGRFRLRLGPGEYVVKPLGRPGSPLPRPPPARDVRVRSGQLTHITITYDTGIR